MAENVNIFTLTPAQSLCWPTVCNECGASGSDGSVCGRRREGSQTQRCTGRDAHACSINLSTFGSAAAVASAHAVERHGTDALFTGHRLCLTRSFTEAASSVSVRCWTPEWCALSDGKVAFHRAVKTPLIYHELFGCYVPSLWTLRTVRTEHSCFYQQLTGKKHSWVNESSV